MISEQTVRGLHRLVPIACNNFLKPAFQTTEKTIKARNQSMIPVARLHHIPYISCTPSTNRAGYTKGLAKMTSRSIIDNRQLIAPVRSGQLTQKYSKHMVCVSACQSVFVCGTLVSTNSLLTWSLEGASSSQGMLFIWRSVVRIGPYDQSL